MCIVTQKRTLFPTCSHKIDDNTHFYVLDAKGNHVCNAFELFTKLLRGGVRCATLHYMGLQHADQHTVFLYHPSPKTTPQQSSRAAPFDTSLDKVWCKHTTEGKALARATWSAINRSNYACSLTDTDSGPQLSSSMHALARTSPYIRVCFQAARPHNTHVSLSGAVCPSILRWGFIDTSSIGAHVGISSK